MNLTHFNGSRVKKNSTLMTYKKPAPLNFQTFEKRYQAMHQITKFLFHSWRPKVSSSWKHLRLIDLAPRWCTSHFFTTNTTVKIVSDIKDSLTTDWNLPTWSHLKKSIYIHESRWCLHPVMQWGHSWTAFLICFSRETPKILDSFFTF